MNLRQHDQHANPGQHAVDHRRRGDAKPAAQAQTPGNQLQEAGQQQDRPQHQHAVLAHQFEHQYRQTRRRAADLQRRAGQPAHHQAADDASDQALGRRHAGRNRDAHAQWQGDQKNNHRGEQLPWQYSFQLSSTHDDSPEAFAGRGKAWLHPWQPPHYPAGKCFRSAL